MPTAGGRFASAEARHARELRRRRANGGPRSRPGSALGDRSRVRGPAGAHRICRSCAGGDDGQRSATLGAPGGPATPPALSGAGLDNPQSEAKEARRALRLYAVNRGGREPATGVQCRGGSQPACQAKTAPGSGEPREQGRGPPAPQEQQADDFGSPEPRARASVKEIERCASAPEGRCSQPRWQ